MKILKFFLIAFSLLFLASVTVSFLAIRKLLFRTDVIVQGKKVSVIAKERRALLKEKYDVEEVSFKTTDDIKLAGLLVKRENAKGNVVLCHGYQRTKEFMSRFVELFDDYNVLLFDFRGNGQSEGKIVTMGLVEGHDVIAATKFIKDRYKDKKLPLVVLGLSMGGAAVMRAANFEPDLCDALIIDSAFKDLRSAVAKSFTYHSGLPNFPFARIIFWMAKYVYSADVESVRPIDFIDEITIPILFTHSSADYIVPTQDSLDLYAESFKAGRNPRVWISPPVVHGMLAENYLEKYKKKVTKFLRLALEKD